MSHSYPLYNFCFYRRIRERKVETLTKNWSGHSKTGTGKHMQKLNQNISTGMAVFLNQKRANVCEHTTKMACSQTFALFWLRKTTIPVEIFWFNFPCVCVCLSYCDLFNFWLEFSLSFSVFCVICTSVFSFPRGFSFFISFTFPSFPFILIHVRYVLSQEVNTTF